MKLLDEILDPIKELQRDYKDNPNCYTKEYINALNYIEKENKKTIKKFKQKI